MVKGSKFKQASEEKVYQPFDFAGGESEDDESTVYFVNKNGPTKKEAEVTKSKSSKTAKELAKEIKSHIPEGAMTARMIGELKPPKKVVMDFFRQRVDELTMLDSDEEDME